MMRRVLALCGATATGVILAAAIPAVPEALRSLVGWKVSIADHQHGCAANKDCGEQNSPEHAATDRHSHEEKDEGHAKEGAITLDKEQIELAGIKVADASEGALSRSVTVPGNIFANADSQQFVVGKIAGVLVDVRKRLGDSVVKGDVLALIEGREIAETKTEYLAAARASELAATVLQRERGLWEKRVSAEQDLQQARANAQEARIRLELARQKLSAIGLHEKEIGILAQAATPQLRVLEIRSPINGRVIDRKTDLGSAVRPDSELFVIADLSTVWVEMAFSTADISLIREGQKVTVANTGNGAKSEGQIVFLNPMISRRTRMARAVALLENTDLRWRPGDFVSATIETDGQRANVLVPRTALQTVEGKQVIFVRTAEGFEKREVVLGRIGVDTAEVIAGLAPGEKIAVSNTFVLKAELGKNDAEHAH